MARSRKPPEGSPALAAGAHTPPRELDVATLAAARRGEPWAQRLFVQRFEIPVFRLCTRMLGAAGRSGAAEDVTQEALLRIVRALPRFVDDGAAKLSTWVLTIATRTVIDDLRRRIRPVVAFDPELALAPDRADEDAQRRAMATAIASALDELAPEIRAAFVLRAYHDLSYPEIAAALEIDLGTVKSRLWRARAALQVRLREVHRG
jgi:RNA polymerase sigma-70 factor (ECF subfamily)